MKNRENFVIMSLVIFISEYFFSNCIRRKNFSIVIPFRKISCERAFSASANSNKHNKQSHYFVFIPFLITNK